MHRIRVSRPRRGAATTVLRLSIPQDPFTIFDLVAFLDAERKMSDYPLCNGLINTVEQSMLDESHFLSIPQIRTFQASCGVTVRTVQPR